MSLIKGIQVNKQYLCNLNIIPTPKLKTVLGIAFLGIRSISVDITYLGLIGSHPEGPSTTPSNTSQKPVVQFLFHKLQAQNDCVHGP